ncbi:MAG: LytTR family DNA-binding domain-containing protein [Bacteroidales bacterium]
MTELKAVDYLLKPISLERLLQALNKFFNERGVRAKGPDPHTEEPDNFLFIRSDRKMVKVFFHDILLVESLGDYLKIHLADRRILVTRDSLSVMESRMPYREFLKTHRSYLVALRWIDSYTSDTICIGKLEVPISRSHREEVLHRLGEY